MSKTIKGMKVMRDGALILHPDAEMRVQTASDSGVKIPLDDTSYGAGFGDAISDLDRAFVACREPVAHFLTYNVAADIVDKWFVVDDPSTETSDPALDHDVQAALGKLKFKHKFRMAIAMSRVFGKALLVGGFSDAQSVEALRGKKRRGASLMQLEVYPRIHQGDTNQPEKTHAFNVFSKETDVMNPRFGEPVIYELDRGPNSKLYVHWTRCVEVGDGISVLDKVWDDMTCGRNIRWGAAQWMYRIGSGFPVVKFPAGTSVETLEEYHNSGQFSNLHGRTAIFIAQNSKQENDGMEFTFEGAASHALDPIPFLQSNLEQVAIATGYPQSKLIGAQAGAVTGSEVNQQDYYKAVSRDQEALEDVVRWTIDCLAEAEQVKLVKAAVDRKSEGYAVGLLRRALRHIRDYRHRVADNYIVNWNSAFELSEVDKAGVDLKRAQANVARLNYMTADEIRAEENMEPLPDSEGAKLNPPKQSMFGGREEQPETRSKRETLEGKQ